MKLGRKIVIIILEIGLIPLLLLSFIGYTNAKRQITENTFSKLDAVAQIQKNRLQDVLQGKIDFLDLFIGKSGLRADLRDFNLAPTAELQAAMVANLQGVKASVASIGNILVANAGGIIVAATDPSALGADISGEDFFKIGIKQKNFSTLKKNADTGLVWQYIAGPLEFDGSVIGLAAIIIDVKDLFYVADDYTGLGDTGETLLAKNDGQGNALFLTPTRFDRNAALKRVVPKDRRDVPSVHAIAGEEAVFSNVVDYRNVPVFAATRYIGDVDWGIVVKIDQAEALAPVKKLQNLFLFLFATAGFFIVLIGVLISLSITDPIKKLAGYADQLAKADFSTTTTTTTTWPKDEIGMLGRTFNAMAVKLKEFYATLEKKVSDRTRDLANLNKATQNVLEDLAEAKGRAEGLAKDLEKFKLALDNTSELVVITDPKGIVVYVNRVVEKITGYKPAEALGKKSGALWKAPMPLEYYQKLWDTIKKQKKVFIGEIQNKRKNGEVYASAITISPIFDKNGAVLYFVSIERDITREKEIEKVRADFLSLASHQLRTPLSGTKWLIETMTRGVTGKVSAKQRQYLDQLYQINERMIKLVFDMLSALRLENESGGVTKKSVPVAGLYGDIVALTGPAAQEKGVTLGSALPIGKEIAVTTDAEMLRSILECFVSNAINYSASGQEVVLDAKEEPDAVVFSVRDSGIGIPKEEQKRIFERFYRASNAKTVKPEGTGLGLYIAHMLAEKIGAEVLFDSEEGKGSIFSLRVPK